MKRSVLIATFTAAAFCIATTPVFAQHGRPPSPGAAGSMGGPHSSASTHSGSGNEGNSGSNSGALAGGTLNPSSKLSGNLQKLLPTGTTPQQVCANFTHLGPCVAAIHVSHNLRIDINSLVCDMTLKPVGSNSCPRGTATGNKGMSLGGAIQALDPNADSKSESGKANQEAKQDMKDSNS
jgi:hypothetical protein